MSPCSPSPIRTAWRSRSSASPAPRTKLGWSNGDVPAEHAIRGFQGVTLLLDDTTKTAKVLTDVFGFRETAREGCRDRGSRRPRRRAGQRRRYL